MNPLTFTTEEDGISSAERALDGLRDFLHTSSSGGRGTAPGLFRVPPVRLGNIDREIALRTQLENLEEMMGMITDARFARSLIEDEDERAFVDQGENEASLEMLRFIVRTARDVLASQTYGNPNGYDDDDTESLNGLREAPGVGPSNSVVVGYVHTGLAGRKDDTPDPACVVCGEVLSLPTGRLESPCGHFYCPDCTINLVVSYTSKQFVSSLFQCCPSPKPPIPAQSVHRFIDETLRQRLDEKLVEANTPLESRIYCPQDNCRKFINPAWITPTARAMGSMICPNIVCRADLCLGCKELAHRGVDCERHADDTQASKIQMQFGWGRCPGCRYVVEKIDGCSHVTCAKCGLGFSYSPMARN